MTDGGWGPAGMNDKNTKSSCDNWLKDEGNREQVTANDSGA